MKAKRTLELAGCVLLICSAATAQTIITFDDLAPGTPVDNQYAAQGITFLPSYHVGIAQDLLNPPSPPNVLDISAQGEEFNESSLTGVFLVPHHHYVQMRVGANPNFGGGGSTVTLTAYDSGDNVLGTTGVTLPPYSPNNEGWVSLAFTSQGNDIAYFKIPPTSNTYFRIDNLEFDTVTGFGPDFSFSSGDNLNVVLAPAGSTPLVPSSVTLQFQIARKDGSFDPICLQYAAPPTGVTPQLSSPCVNDPGITTVTLTLTADSSAPPVQNFPMVLTATPSDANAGAYGPHVVKLRVSVVGTFDARIVNMEVTQGIQDPNLPARPIDPATGDLSVSVPYSGVDLAYGKQTTVRVFAGMKNCSLAANAPLPLIQCLLYGKDQSGNDLPGSPLANWGFAAGFVCFPDAGIVPDAQRMADDYRFTLPRSWSVPTGSSISLTAVLGQPSYVNQLTTGLHDWVECCPNNQTFSLRDIPFVAVNPISFNPVGLIVSGQAPIPPQDVLAKTMETLPIREDEAAIPAVYGNWWDITDIWNKNESDVQRGNDALSVLKQKLDDWNELNSGDVQVGVFPTCVSGVCNQIRGTEGSGCGDSFWDCDGGPAAVFQDKGRDLTDAAHEVGHLLNRPHAGHACGADAGGCTEDWPPDSGTSQGHLFGYGFVRETGAVLPPDSTFFDVMSYCTYADDTVAWISVRGWEESWYALSFRAVGYPPISPCGSGAFPSPSGAPASVQVPYGSMLSVRAIITDTNGGGRISSVAPTDVSFPGVPANSPCSLIARDANSNVVAIIPMWFELVHVDDAPYSGAVHACVPTNGVASVEVNWNGIVVDKRTRSPHSPVVRVTGVESGLPSGGTNDYTVTAIKWTATDVDNDPLLTKVDFSTDNGLTWRNVFIGPDRGSVSLPDSTFGFAREALVRLRVSDGFNETITVSWPFPSVGAPPSVHIFAPAAGQKFSSEQSIYCRGSAFDDRHQQVPDTNILWYAGHRQLGHGRSISVTDLPPCSHTLTMVAYDYLGRLGSDSVTINLSQPGITNSFVFSNPALIDTNVALWLSADTGVQADTNGLVSAWTDQTGQGYVAVQPNPTNQPVLVPDAMLNRPALQFGPGSNQFLTIANQVVTSPYFTVMAVINDQATNDNARMFFSSTTNGLTPNPTSFGVGGGVRSPETAVLSGAFGSVSGTVGAPGLFYVLSAVVAAGPGGSNTASLYQNQRLIASVPYLPPPTSSMAAPFAIGEQAGGLGDTFWRGQVAELLVYNTALPSDEMRQVYEYFQAKYGLLPSVPQISSIQVTNNTVLLSFNKNANRIYVLQSTDFLSPQPIPWVTVTNLPAAPAPSQVLIADPVSNGRRFYRLVIPGS